MIGPASSLVKSLKDHRLSTLVLVLALALSGFVPQVASAAGWTPTAPLSSARDSHTATLLPNGKVLVVGGSGNNYAVLQSTELYNPAGFSPAILHLLCWNKM